MKPFDYVRPATLQQAVAAASQPGAAYLAAGTNLLDLMKGGISRPDSLVERRASSMPYGPTFFRQGRRRRRFQFCI